MDLREVGYDCRDWINLAQDRGRWRPYVRAAMNLRVPEAICKLQTNRWELMTVSGNSFYLILSTCWKRSSSSAKQMSTLLFMSFRTRFHFTQSTFLISFIKLLFKLSNVRVLQKHWTVGIDVRYLAIPRLVARQRKNKNGEGYYLLLFQVILNFLSGDTGAEGRKRVTWVEPTELFAHAPDHNLLSRNIELFPSLRTSSINVEQQPQGSNYGEITPPRRKRNAVIHSGEREIIANIIKCCEEEKLNKCLLEPLHKEYETAAKYSGKSISSVKRIKNNIELQPNEPHNTP
ncbi:hypothetical protein ANN_04889 [Periplaneta americana]|uniref:Uncharacterized protein n=1 Tax=Periplaneta americana TaxID=6978 RepID=A0ABQ8TB76_PERAM|nr:hypothetical protein ANN_04889 [Periplaneta americana]